jgi:hypothetical protein
MLNQRNPSQAIFKNESAIFPAEAEFASFNRMIWISETHCLIETNLKLKVGQILLGKNLLLMNLTLKKSN